MGKQTWGRAGAAGLAALLLAAEGPATEAPVTAASDGVVRLSPEQIDAIADEAEARARAAPRDTPAKRRIHGEIEASIGTGGTRSLDAVAHAPLGSHGDARISGSAVRGLPERPLRRNLDRR